MKLTMLWQMRAYAESCEREGWYYGNREQFEARHTKIMEWLDTDSQSHRV